MELDEKWYTIERFNVRLELSLKTECVEADKFNGGSRKLRKKFELISGILSISSIDLF